MRRLRGRSDPTTLEQPPPQNELDLRIEAAQVIIRPALDRLQHSRVNAEKKCFALGHVLNCRLPIANCRFEISTLKF